MIFVIMLDKVVFAQVNPSFFFDLVELKLGQCVFEKSAHVFVNENGRSCSNSNGTYTLADSFNFLKRTFFGHLPDVKTRNSGWKSKNGILRNERSF